MSNPKLALIPSGYNTGKVYSILPNDGSGDFTFARTGDATRVRKDGLIETAATTVPRLDWLNSDCPILLLEPQRTNLAHYSEQTDNIYWIKTNVSVTANQITSPDGTLTADKLQRTSTSSARLAKEFTKTASEVQNFSLSVFVKKGDSRYATLSLQGDYPDRAYLQYDFEQGTINASIDFEDFTILSTKAENFNDGWVRLSLALSTDAHSSVTVLISPKNDAVTTALSDSSDSCFMYVWGIQLENDTYSTSYIETPADASVTRNADVCKIADFSSMPSSYPITVYGEVIPNELSTSSYAFSLLKDVDTIGNYYLALNLRSTSFVKIIRRDSDTNDEETISHTLAVGTPFKFAVCFQNATNFKYSFDGLTTVSVTTSDTVTWDFGDVLLGALRLSSDTGSRNPIKDFRLYDTELTDAELIELTT